MKNTEFNWYEVTAYHTPPFILITFTPVLVCVPQCLVWRSEDNFL
ncbi:rCG54806, partial [Rattus norvegicus]